jgi:transcriptional regulator with AAA-type ATPase domain
MTITSINPRNQFTGTVSEINIGSVLSEVDAPLERALLDIFERGGNALYADIEQRVMRCAFEYCEHNQLQTAKLLGISRNILRHRLKLYGLL